MIEDGAILKIIVECPDKSRDSRFHNPFSSFNTSSCVLVIWAIYFRILTLRKPAAVHLDTYPEAPAGSAIQEHDGRLRCRPANGHPKPRRGKGNQGRRALPQDGGKVLGNPLRPTTRGRQALPAAGQGRPVVGDHRRVKMGIHRPGQTVHRHGAQAGVERGLPHGQRVPPGADRRRRRDDGAAPRGHLRARRRLQPRQRLDAQYRVHDGLVGRAVCRRLVQLSYRRSGLPPFGAERKGGDSESRTQGPDSHV